MGLKVYTCARYPQIAIAGVCRFVDGVFDTDDPNVQGTIEKTDSFKAGIVKVLDLHEQVAEEWEKPAKSLLVKMKKSEIETVANRMGLVYALGCTKAELLDVVLANYDS